MNYGGNMPDWHQFNASQTNEVTPPTQNVNSGHLAFIPGVSTPTLNALSLSSESLNKHQNDSNYNPRNFQTLNNVQSGSNIPNNSPLTSMVQMQNCIGHYGSPNTRNPILDNLNTSVDPRNNTIAAINDDLGYRNNQVPFNGPIGHLNGPSCNLNASSGPGSGPGPGARINSGPGPGTSPGTGTASGSMFRPGPRHGPVPGPGPGSGSGPANMGPRNTNISSVPHGKPGPPPFIPCKGLCCNPDPNINYQQWDKFGSYQNNTTYRDNIHPPGYQMENRHYGNNYNYRKDGLESKEVMGPVLPNATTVDHRRNFTDYKYHKDHLVHRNYPASSGMYHNYTMQNYNYSTEHQKYSYPVKEHPKTNNMNISNSGMIKQQEQNFIAQQKFNNKQFQYQNGNMVPKGVPTLNVNTNMPPSPQNSYHNSQFTRNISTEMSQECHETTDNTAMVNRMQGTFMHGTSSQHQHQHQLYQHKITMQKFSMENHLRELSRISGYQSHPKYKECVLKYRELLKLQQSVGYQNPLQQTARVATPVNSTMPINLQFDQNGMLVNSNYLPDSFPKLQHIPPTEQPPESIEKQNKDQPVAIAAEKCHQTQQPEQLMIPSQNEHMPSSCAESGFHKQSQFSLHKDFNQNQMKVQRNESHSFNTLSADVGNEAMIQQKGSKEFANKPELDVRQFLANWDETDDEDASTSNLPGTVLSETTPVVVVSYENVDLSSKTSQSAEMPNRNSLCSNEPLNNEKGGKANVISAQDCLTISYSPSENAEMTKAPKQTIREGVVKPGSIIHCISNGPDEIPTIHIVDNLEISSILEASSSQVIQTLEKQKTISFFRETDNNSEAEDVALENSDEHEKNETLALSGNYETSLDNANKNVEDSSISETIETAGASMNSQELQVLSASAKTNLDVTENLELKKQSSFTSEESHNPDDISLPDLPTSECTPISTTLNTPIHSDSEESSENIEDLTISTNPIEVMQNSPVISFTQSPVKMEPYGQLSEDKLKNRSLDTLELELQKESRYKNSDNSSGEQDVSLNNFDFSASDSKAKSAEAAKAKLAKNLGSNPARKKVFPIDSKENDASVSETCAALRSIEYDLEDERETVDDEKRSECESPNGGKRKGVKSTMKSGDSTASVANLNPTEFDDETQASKDEGEAFKRQKIKSLNLSINTVNPSLSESDLNAERRRIKDSVWDDKCIEKYLEMGKSSRTRKRDTEHSRQSKKFPGDESSSSQSGEHFVCHMTSQYKNYSVAVIKDNVILSDKKSYGTTERNAELQSKNTKELSEEAEIRKHVSSRVPSSTHETVHSQSSKRSDLLQKDLKTVDGDVRYTTDEIRMLKEYRRRKDRLYQAQDMHDNDRDDKMKSKDCNEKDEDNVSFHPRNDQIECSQVRQNNDLLAVYKVCLEQNMSSMVNLSSENSKTPEETKRHSYSKCYGKGTNSDFGIQVANVNLKIKENEIGKELILADKGQEHIKDSLEGIKIEINVSCTDRNSKEQEHAKRLLFENFRNADDDSLDYQRQLHAKEHDTMDNSRIFDKAHKIAEKSPTITDAVLNEGGKTKNDAATSPADASASTAFKKGGKGLLEANEDAFSCVASKETCGLTLENQAVAKLLGNNVSGKDTKELVESTSHSPNDANTFKSKCAIPNTAIVDANKILSKTKSKFAGEREDFCNPEGDRVARAPKQSSADTFQRNDEKDVASGSHPLKTGRKLSEANVVELSAKSLNSLSGLNLSFDKLDQKRCSGMSFERAHADEVGEFDDGYAGKWKKPKIDHIFEDCDMFQSTSGYINPIFSSIDKLEDLHTVPVYTTKDGKISYSPNRKFTHHELMLEARKREGSVSARKTHYTEAWNSCYSSKFRKLYKKKRHHPLSDRKKYEYKSTKYLYERKRNYLDEFCGRNHVKYRDYVHSIKNNSAAWAEHGRMDRMYSSSDSDEDIMNRGRNRVQETSNYRKCHAIEDKPAMISKPRKSDAVEDDLDLVEKNKESTASGVHLDKAKDSGSEEIQSIQPHSLNDSKDNENCQSTSDSNNIPFPDANTSLVSVSEQEHPSEIIKSDADVCSSAKESPAPTESCDFSASSVDLSEKNHSNDECTRNVDETETRNVSDNDERISTSQKLLKEVSSLDENDHRSENQTFSSRVLEKEEGSEMDVSKQPDSTDPEERKEENDKKADPSNNQTSLLEPDDHSETTDTHKDLEESESEVNKANYFLTKEISEFRTNDDEIEQASEDFLKSEQLKNMPTEATEKSSEINSNETDKEKFEESENLEQKSVELSEDLQAPSEEEKQEETDNKKIEENTEAVEYQNRNSPKDSARDNDNTSITNQKESESQIMQIDETTDEENRICISSEKIENEETVKENTEREATIMVAETKESISTYTPSIENNIAENSIASDKNEPEIIPPNTEESPTENSAVALNDLKENSNDSCPAELQSIGEQKANFSRGSSVEEDMPVLSSYLAVKNCPDEDTESGNRTTEEKCRSTSIDSHEGDHLSENGADAKVVPKLVIKKTDTLAPKPECSLDCAESDGSASRYDAKLKSDVRPKIPKMIIVKNRSRSATPIVEILEKAKSDRTPSLLSEQNDASMDVDNSDSESYTLKYNNYESKVPKVRIKLEDISSKDLKLYLKRKAAKSSVPKVKIKKIKTQSGGSATKFEPKDNSESDVTDSEEDDEEKVPKLKLKRQDEEKSPDRTKGKDTSSVKTPLKKNRRTKEEDAKHPVKTDNITANDEALKKKYSHCIAEKIPKVIIKRTQIGTEFKCEISNSKKTSIIETSKWQPKVKLQRLEALDHLVRDLQQSRIALRLYDVDNDDTSRDTNTKLYRSSSASSLSPIKCKQRRLSDPDYTKVDIKLAGHLRGIDVHRNDNKNKAVDAVKASGLKTSDVENKGLRRKSKKRLLSHGQGKRNLITDDSETETRDEVDGRNSFSNILSNEDNDPVVVKKEYSLFEGKESTSSMNDNVFDSVRSPRDFDDNENSIIKVDTSDDSQTTIEMLPASPDSSDDETKNCKIEDVNRLHMEDAMPTQLELELELIDNNNMQRSDALAPKIDESGSRYFTEFERSSQSTFNQSKYRIATRERSQSPEKKGDYFYCNDSLVKEVLAAKETLKKCLTRSEKEVAEKSKSKPKTAAEKKQGLSFSFKDLGRSCCKSGDPPCNDDTEDATVHRKSKPTEKNESTSEPDTEEAGERCSKQEKHCSVGKKAKKDSQDGTSSSMDRPTVSTCEYTTVPESTIISLKATKKFGRIVTNEASSVDVVDLPNGQSNDAEGSNREKGEDKWTSSTQDLKGNHGSSETKTKEDNMPLLVPEIALNFDSSSDRDSSRSPPVITNQEEVEGSIEDSKNVESKVISPIEKIEDQKHSYKDCEMTIADIITQLAYHEKATIKHRRYCNLCERWFPTTSRHRRHLAGYQHRYMELTQRKSIHALFILFTGKPCPRLLPANVIRNDCSIGELTPLQIAVQDIAKCVEHTQQNLKTKE